MSLQDASIQKREEPVDGFAGGATQGGLKKDQDVTLKWTRDPNDLVQYFEIRKAELVPNFGNEYYPWSLDATDMNSHILVAKVGNKVIGGARLTVKNEIDDNMLPMESEKFQLDNVFPEYELSKNKCAELSRMALHKGYSDGRYSMLMHGEIVKKVVGLGVKCLFIYATKKNSRLFRRNYNLGFDIKLQLRDDIEVPVREILREDLKFFISVVRL